MIGFDPLYFLFIGPALLLGIWAQFQVKSAYAMASQIAPRSGMSGAEAARYILNQRGLTDVGIETSQGMLSDHYDPRDKTLRLSPDVYNGRSLAAVGIAAHESGHALQDAGGYAPLAIRNGIVPLASVGSSLSWGFIFIGFLLQSFGLVMAGVLLFSLAVVFQLINLPVEFNASNRAREVLLQTGLVTADEEQTVGRVLNAAAMTYVAATVTAVLTLLYYLVRLGVIGGSRNDR